MLIFQFEDSTELGQGDSHAWPFYLAGKYETS